MDEVQAIITLRSGKEIEQPVSKPVGKTREHEEGEPEHIIIKEDSMKGGMPLLHPPAPPPPPPISPSTKRQRKASKQEGIMEVLRQVKVNIPLLDMIKQVPNYAKFLKDLCTVKKGLGINKKAFLTEQVSSIIQCKTLLKYKDLGSPTISVNIGGTCIDKALLDLGASVNLLPYSMYKQLGLGELKPTNITLSLADRSVKIPKGIVEDVLVKVDNFYLLGYGQNIQSDWNINADEIKKFYPLTHQGSHAFHKNRRKGKRNLPLVDRFVKPSKSASWFVRIFKGDGFLKSDHPLQVSTHEQIINDLLNASSGSSSQNEIRVFSFSLVLVGSPCKRQLLIKIYIYVSHIYLYKSSRVLVKHEFIRYLKLFLNLNPYLIRKLIYIIIYLTITVTITVM